MIDENNSDINEELTIAVCGPVDAGKSTIIGVLTSGELDNGKGLARNKVLIHPHEIESGRTSNITFNPLIYNISNNRLTHYVFNEIRNKKNSIIKKQEIDFYDENLLDTKLRKFRILELKQSGKPFIDEEGRKWFLLLEGKINQEKQRMAA